MITASEFNALKARIKAECERRRYSGSVASYAGTSYDYTNAAAANKIIRLEHYTKIATPMTAIDGVSRPNPSIIKQSDLTALDTKLTTLEGYSETATSRAETGCAVSCTGLCYSLCSGSCRSGCYESCRGGCSEDCEDDCYESCDSGCTGSCGDGCTSTCTADCSGGCLYGCYGGCADNCASSCYNDCSGAGEYVG